MSTQSTTYLSPDEYLAIERKAEYKSEYFKGEMFPLRGMGKPGDVFAMVGASRKHNLIVANFIVALGPQLRGTPWELYPSDMRVSVPATDLYTYPDVVVSGGDPKFEDTYLDTLLNPALIVEVRSPSTAFHDRVTKFEYYRRIEALTEYLLVAQDEYRVEQYSKQADGRWLLTDISSLEGVVELPSIQCTLRLADIYARVELT